MSETPRTRELWGYLFGPEEDWTENQKKAAALPMQLESELATLCAERDEARVKLEEAEVEVQHEIIRQVDADDISSRAISEARRERDAVRARAEELQRLLAEKSEDLFQMQQAALELSARLQAYEVVLPIPSVAARQEKG
jgi:uncharacterized coiled-coil DUF342 family protein